MAAVVTVESAPGTPGTNAGQDRGAFEFIASETWAEQTGGIATHHNDLKGALAEDIQNGSSYYTLAYTPTDPREIGRERKITVRMKEEGYKLSYRRNYFERTSAEIKTDASQAHDRSSSPADGSRHAQLF